MNPAGDTLNNDMAKRERNEEKTEDPFSLPYGKGIHSYWAAKNSWSLDGLPGVQSVAHMVKDGPVDEVLHSSGLTRESINLGKKRRVLDLPPGLTVGILIGFSLAVVAHAVMDPPIRSFLANLRAAA